MMRFFVILSYLLLIATPVCAQMNLRLDYPEQIIEVGEQVEIEITVTGVTEGTRFLNFDDQLPEEIALIGVTDTFIGSSLFKRIINIIPIDEDTTQFQLNLKYRKEFEADSIQTEEITLISALIPVDEQAELSDFKPFIEPNLPLAERLIAEYPNAPYIIIAALICLIVGLIIWFYSRFKSRKEDLSFEEELEEIEDPIERVQTAIKLLESSSMNEKDWYTEWSDQIRWYLGKAYGFNGMELTSKELMAELQNQSEIMQTQSELNQALRNADLVKYADTSLSTDSMEQALSVFKQLVANTKHFFLTEEEVES